MGILRRLSIARSSDSGIGNIRRQTFYKVDINRARILGKPANLHTEDEKQTFPMVSYEKVFANAWKIKNSKNHQCHQKPKADLGTARQQKPSEIPRLCRLMSVWSTSTGGLDLGKNSSKGLDTSSTTRLYNRGHNKFKMSTTDDELHTPRYLSWRKLHLSRAKLKASSKTSALLSGFAMVAMVELQLQQPNTLPGQVLVAFAIITTLLVAVHMLALMISTCILPNIEVICSLDSVNLVNESPHERLHWYIEIAWAFSTLLGLLLFLAEIAIICWVKFYDTNMTAAWSAGIVLLPFLFVFLAFAIHFYRSLVAHKYETTLSGIRELEMLKEKIDVGEMEGNHENEQTNNLMWGVGVQIV